ncbi:oxalurate catabolism protein HpxZ [Citreicella sp. C3M06]|uniref:oxalurate catabolism protein HpxZ n=1 Tax=Citreicella sp. C3M06 TaxID=2841564 RepID=UPI001C090885|nr:oxalurate catabolism protein HpxZ [Citreicella sp. C3M06]MBU2961422.1 oxalurate catabolism protein HpxZ [Citreicella sp. C3M06]
MTRDDINLPGPLAEITAAFNRYEAALIGNDVEVLDELFLIDARTIRYGIAENLYGHAEIAEFRASRPATGHERRLDRTVITSYGSDFATAMTLFHRGGGDRIGRQSQTWARIDGNWRIVAAHVSVIPTPEAV